MKFLLTLFLALCFLSELVLDSSTSFVRIESSSQVFTYQDDSGSDNNTSPRESSHTVIILQSTAYSALPTAFHVTPIPVVMSSQNFNSDISEPILDFYIFEIYRPPIA